MAVIKKSPGKRQRTLQMKSEKTKPLEGLGALITSNLKKVKKLSASKSKTAHSKLSTKKCLTGKARGARRKSSQKKPKKK